MLQLNYIRENKEEVISRLSVKNFDGRETVGKIIESDVNRRETQKLLDDNLAEANQIAKEIGNLFKSGKTNEANELKEKSAKLKVLSAKLKDELDETEKQLNSLLVQLPNLPHHSVNKGKTAEDNVIVHEEGGINLAGFENLRGLALPHWELGVKYGILDFERGVKITGSGFPVYRGKGAKLQRALINFFLDSAVKAGFTEIEPPVLINEESAFGTGQLPDKDSQMYYVSLDNFYLVPTAEVPVTNLYRNEILKAEELPIRNAAYTSCFRREAGSYGKDVRGLNRLHQFDKVEIVVIEHPDKSYEMLEEMKEYVSGLLRKLELPFRVLKLCGGDMSFTSALTYDMEVFSGAQNKWLEVSSVSNFESFQSNRMKLRFRDTDGKIKLLHTLNGSALALPRIVAALLENNQSNEGIKIPKALHDYTGFDIISH
jgi:seryl-tRNA synthetase